MTFNELKDEIVALGFDEVPGRDTALAHFANRALERIFSDRGVRASTRLYIRRARAEILYSDLPRRRDRDLSLQVGEGSLYLCVCGEGSVCIRDKSGERQLEFCAEQTVIKQRLGEDACLIFSGEHDYVIVKLAVYRESFGSSIDAIPEPCREKRIFLRDRIPDFLSLDGLPTDERGRTVFCLCRGDDEILLSEDFSGTLCVSYKRAPRLISPSLPNEKIDIGNDLRPLLPLLTASYMLIEYDSELSDFYEREYAARMNMIGKRASPADHRYYDVTGW